MNELRAGWWAESERDPVHLAAADWLVRLQNPQVSLEETLAWQAWMNEDAKHAKAFARVEAVSLWAQEISAPREASPRELARDTYDASVPLKDWQAPAPTPRLRIFAVAASILVGAVGLGIAFYLRASLLPDAAPGYEVATAVGENRTVSLRDGSKITLGGDTRIAVDYSENQRDIELSRGEALFTVTRDATRPFKVRTGDATVIALGTEFNVRRERDRLIVSVTEGRVLVEPVTHFIPVTLLQEFKPKLRPVRLDAGQQATAGSAGIERAEPMEDPAAATAWQSGQLSFRMEPLRYVLENVNRYAPKPIVLEDESLGTLVITGMVKRENFDGWIRSLERTFGLDAVEEPDRIVMRRR